MDKVTNDSAIQLLTVVLVGFFSIYLFLKYASRKVGHFSSRYVLVTGCDSGFGKMTAVRLDKLGFHVFAACLTKEGQQELKAVCSDRVVTLLLDVTDSEKIERAYSTVCSHLPQDTGLWGLINNAGIFRPGPLEWHTLQTFKKMADINIWGMIELSMTFMPLLKKSRGRVVNTSSAAGFMGVPGFGPYCISKFAVEAFSDVLRREMSPWGVLVSVIEPGPFRTGLVTGDALAQMLQDMWDNTSARIRGEYGEDFLRQAKDGFYQWGENSCQATYLVVDAYVDAVTSSWPRPRYRIGTNARLLAFLFWLPDFLADFVIGFLFRKQYPRHSLV